MSWLSAMRKVCIQVDQRFGEQLRVLLVEQQLLELNFPITKEENTLIFPLRRTPTKRELMKLQETTGKLRLVEKELDAVQRKPSDLTAALQGKVPEDLLDTLPHSLDIIGEIAIVELNETLVPYEILIGEAIMVVNSRITTVYAKAGSIKGMRRLRSLRLIAGKDQRTTVHTEFGIKLAIDVTQTYFSPRLSTEHDRVSRQVQPNEVIVDMFTGVGPFALLAAKRHRVRVYAIDINKQAIQCLRKSLELNRLVGEVIPLVGDARVIIQDQLRQTADRIIMNLPHNTFEYLDAGLQALKPEGGVIHYYGVTTETLPPDMLRSNVLHRLADLGREGKILKFRIVRPAAPHEDHVVLDIQVSPRITTSAM